MSRSRIVLWLALLINFSSFSVFADPVRVVISGGPGRGKSSIISKLETLGELTLKETALDYINLEIAEGVNEPWLKPNFQTNINVWQQSREESVDSSVKVVFQDRSLVDSFGYSSYRKQALSPQLQAQRDHLKLESRYYKFVFFVNELPESGKAERFDLAEDSQIDAALRVEYLKLGYEIIDIAAGSVINRVNFILTFLKDKGAWSPDRTPLPLVDTLFKLNDSNI